MIAAALALFLTSQGDIQIRPLAFEIFCNTNPSECVEMPANPISSAELPAIQREMNAIMAGLVPTEEDGDTWSIVNSGPADCEDFALTLRSALRSRFPGHGGAFRITTAYTEQNQYHAVLSLETDVGTWVCDIRYAECQPWSYLPYQWRLREQPGVMWQVLGPYVDIP